MSKILGALLIIYSVSGYLAHLSRPFTVGGIDGKWRNLTSYAMGILCLIPLSTFMFDLLENDVPHPTIRHVVVDALTAGSFGIGVGLGYRYDR